MDGAVVKTFVQLERPVALAPTKAYVDAALVRSWRLLVDDAVARAAPA